MLPFADNTLALAYGSGTQSAPLPEHWSITTLRTAVPTGRRSEFSVVSEALSAPIGAPPLHSTVSPTDKLLVLVSDKTRRCRTAEFLPLLLEQIERAGVPDTKVRILFATGTHPPQSDAERREILGDGIFERYEVYEHDARDTENCVCVGTTRFGTEIAVNRLVLWADRVLATGTIVHHYFAGFGGGAKLFVPGIASYETAVTNHRRTLTDDGSFHPQCRDGQIEGNPVIEDIMDAMRFMPPTWYFAALLDEHGKIDDAVCGDLLLAHAEGCRRVGSRYHLPVPSPMDLCIVSTGGYPKDINFIQSHKSLHHAAYVTREGGSIILLAECAEGIGNEQFMEWFAHPDEAAFRNALLTNYAMNAHTALAMREKSERFDIHFVSTLPDATVRQLGMKPAASLEAALASCAPRVSASAEVLVLENGSLVVPRLKTETAPPQKGSSRE